MILYPLKFTPILKQKIWGGNSLVEKFNKKSDLKDVGESWELSGVKGSESIIANGAYKGISIIDLLSKYKENLLGVKIYKEFGEEFPLLFKFIDASDDLSIQLHPNDELAKKRHNSFGKTEMWYVLDAEKESKLYAGLNRAIAREEYLDFFDKGKLLDIIYVDNVKKGDAFFIDVGTIHAIGEGIVLAEIQQTSDITYRIYDWDRVDKNGKGRELHTDLALDAIDFAKVGSCKLNFEKEIDKINNIFKCQYFTTNKLKISEKINRNFTSLDSFVVYMCVEGEGEIIVDDKIEDVNKGETVLIPASVNHVSIKNNENFELLEVFID